MTVEKELKYLTQQGNINITKEDVFIHLRKMENWKASGPDELHEFLLKKFTSLHQAMVRHLDDEWYEFWLKKFTSLHQAMVKHQNKGCSQLDGRMSGSPYAERFKKGECCW